MNHIRSKIYGKKLSQQEFSEIVKDVVAGNLSDIQIAAFVSACVTDHLDKDEITSLTRAMLDAGSRIKWPQDLIVDKHCLGGLPGNRTTIVVVPIIAACGLTIPKTSSRAITSSAGTADTMETLAPVALEFAKIRKVVEQENGCIAWGDAAELSPADDITIRIERGLNLDSQGQMVASILSKKIAAGSTHVLIDMPVGPTAKVRDQNSAEFLEGLFKYVGKNLNINVETIITDGTKPVGRGIGPALEAYDVLAVLQNQQNAPQDLKERSLLLAGKILEFSPQIKKGEGLKLAIETLANGKAWKKFQAICEAQGGMRTPPKAAYTFVYVPNQAGIITSIDNRKLAMLAKLAGAPNNKAAGVYLHNNVGDKIEQNQPLLTIHANHTGELDYAVNFLKSNESFVQIA